MGIMDRFRGKSPNLDDPLWVEIEDELRPQIERGSDTIELSAPLMDQAIERGGISRDVITSLGKPLVSRTYGVYQVPKTEEELMEGEYDG